MEGIPRSFMWCRMVELESAIEDRPKSAQVGLEITEFFFLKANCNHFKDVVLVAPFNAVYGEVVAVDCEHLSQV